jgi:hypothetical protein
MKSHIFWGITPCGPLKINTFRTNMSPPSSGSELATCFMLVSCLASSSTLKMEAICVPPKRRLTFNRLHGVISHKIGLFKM